MTASATSSRRALWRLHLGMAVFWILLLGLMYLAMEHYLEPRSVVVANDGSLQVPRHRDGHFYVDGSVNGQAVRFLVDTGASSIAVSDALAQKAGLQGGEQVTFRTANGVRMGYLVRAQRITVGPLQAQNLTVGTGYTGRNEQDALLGQNFLRQFDVRITNDVLELKPKAP